MTGQKPSADRTGRPPDREAGLRRIAEILGALEGRGAGLPPPPAAHRPGAGEVGEFAYAWFTQGARQALANFAPVADHLKLSTAAPEITAFVVPVADDRSGAARMRRADVTLPAWTASDVRFGASRAMASSADASFRWGARVGAPASPPRRGLPGSLLAVVERAREACRVCGDLVDDTFRMALDEGDRLHASHRARASSTRPSRRVQDEPAAAAAPLPDWGRPAALMPDFALAMAPPAADDEWADDASPVARTYEIGASRLALVAGDLARSAAEALVSSDDDALAMGGGVSRALLEASGHLLRHEAGRALAAARPAVGDVVVTGAPGLDARFVLHAVTLRNVRGKRMPVLVDGSVGAVVRLCVHRAFDLVDALGVRSIAFPVIAAGAARVPYGDAMHEMADAIVSRLLVARRPVSVEVYLHDHRGRHSGDALVDDFARHVARRRELEFLPEGDAIRVRSWLDDVDVPVSRPARPAAYAQASPSFTAAMPEGRRLQALVRVMARLDERRATLERAHLEAIVGKEPSEPGVLEALSRRLATLRSRRAAIEEMVAAPNPPPSDPGAVFVGSTWSDLRECRAAVREAIGARGLEFVGVEGILASPAIPRDATLPYVTRAGAFVAIVGWRYGSADEATGLSFTELEYVHAVGQRRPVLAFLMDESVPVKPSDLDPDPEGYQRLLAFRKALAARHDAVTFTDPADLAQKVSRALGNAPA